MKYLNNRLAIPLFVSSSLACQYQHPEPSSSGAVSDTTRFAATFDLRRNPIVIENEQPGAPAYEWDVMCDYDGSIRGFATAMSVNRGDTVHFKIDSPVSYHIAIFRLGYYGGAGAKRMGEGTINVALPQSQPLCALDKPTRLYSCASWQISAHWKVPHSAISGVYLAKLTRDDNGGSNHIVFVVRDDSRCSDLLFQTADATWQAYNTFHGYHFYPFAGPPALGRAVKVSYDRPFDTRISHPADFLFNAEYPMIRWLERNGYDVSYTTCVDMDSLTSMNNHKVFLSVGHDEYWSKGQYDKVVAARNSGVHLAFFSGNEVYWKTRWEDNHRVLVCYKEGRSGEYTDPKVPDPTNIWTSLWREASPPAKDNNPSHPEQLLTGQAGWVGGSSAIVVPSSFAALPFWRQTSIVDLLCGDSAVLTNGSLGYEWDSMQAIDYPKYRLALSRTRVIQGRAIAVHELSLYRDTISGSLVFGAGTVQWSWGLDDHHDNGHTSMDIRMQQATVNLFTDMGVRPGSRQCELVLDRATAPEIWDDLMRGQRETSAVSSKLWPTPATTIYQRFEE